jgi:hypothetical protein
MNQYVVAIYHPNDYDRSQEGPEMFRDIGALNEEMKAARVRIYFAGLSEAKNATSIRVQPDAKVSVTDGPYTEAKEHVAGFWVLACADLAEAQHWGRKAAKACRAAVEIRQAFQRVEIDWPRI